MAIIILMIALVLVLGALILFYLFTTFRGQSPGPQSDSQSYPDVCTGPNYPSTYPYFSVHPSGSPCTEESSLVSTPDLNHYYSPPSTFKRSRIKSKIQNVFSHSQPNPPTAGETTTGRRHMNVSTVVKSILKQKFAKQGDRKFLRRVLKKPRPGTGSIGPIEEKECVVCTDIKTVTEFPKQLTPHCRHTTDACEICVDHWVATELEEGKVPIQCIDEDCQAHLDHKAIRLLLKKENLQKYEEVLKNMARKDSPSLNLRFSRPAEKHMEREAHVAGLSSLGMQDCPHCGITIKKEDGCDHIVCRGSSAGKNFGCGFEFCYLCRAPYAGKRGIRSVGNKAHTPTCKYYM